MGEGKGVSEACEIFQVVPQTQGPNSRFDRCAPQKMLISTRLGNLAVLEGHGKGPKPGRVDKQSSFPCTVCSQSSQLTKSPVESRTSQHAES